MTLPQQLDPFTLDDNPTLAVALKHSKLPYTAEQSEYTDGYKKTDVNQRVTKGINLAFYLFNFNFQ